MAGRIFEEEGGNDATGFILSLSFGTILQFVPIASLPQIWDSFFMQFANDLTCHRRLPARFLVVSQGEPDCVKSLLKCHPRESGDPYSPNLTWIPTFVGMTIAEVDVFTQSRALREAMSKDISAVCHGSAEGLTL